MKHTLLFSLLFTGFFSVVGQDDNVKKLKDAQESRKKYINPETENAAHAIPRSTMKSKWVNPFIGTGGHGHTYPGSSAPFGMMQLSPDTRYDGWDGCSGYHYSDSIMYGFSHTHLSGVGVPDYCDLLIVPQSGKAKTVPGYLAKDGYGTGFNHKNEKASPGLYEVKLNNGIDVRLTSSERCGLHEYTFKNKGEKRFVLIDLDHRDRVISYELNTDGNTKVSGYRISEAWAYRQHFYFSLECSSPFKKSKFITKNGQHKLLLEFDTSIEKLFVKVGMSAVDIEGATKNLQTEIPDFSFYSVYNKTLQKWNDELEKIDFYSPDDNVMYNFYTALYHSFLNPNLFSDVDGRYRGRDEQIHTLPDNSDRQYTVFSLWDTYRATHPLFTLTQQEKTGEFVRTFLRQFDEGKDLPVWELAGNETECMIGYHSVSVIADAYTKGIQNFDEQKALNAMITTSNLNELAKQQFANNGFISLSDEPESVSKTLEYAYDDFCISQMAAEMQNKLKQNETIVNQYKKRAVNFVNLYDPSTKFMRARRYGLWYAPFDPNEVNFNYTEANSWQYSLYAPHAVGLLSDLMGGTNELEKWLDNLFTAKAGLSGREQADITGLIGQYAHGNEPSHHMAYLYNYTAHPHKTQNYVDRILKEMYSNTPEGLSGNEDCGQMSSWYVLSALGLYQIAPSNPYYEIGRPICDKATFKLENKNLFTIETKNNSPENKYIQKISLNGKPINRLYLHHNEINNGGSLLIEMGDQPNQNVDLFEHAPTINETPADFIPVPHFQQEERTFADDLLIAVSYPKLKNKNFEIHYTTDGTEPTASSPLYTIPFSIHSTTHVKIALYNPATKSMGKSVSNDFVKRDSGVSIKLGTKYANQYTAGGDVALIDGIQGGNEYRTGDWQGYFGEDLKAEVSFETPKMVNEISIRCIEDIKSWIFYPQSVSFEVSYDGTHFEPLKTIENKASEDHLAKSTRLFSVQTTKKEAIKKIRVTAKNFGKCPSWHLGAGNNTWLFVDEIIFR